MDSDLEQRTLYPGAVTTKYGLYLVTHSTAHHPATETFIDRGIALPRCNVAGCQVTFRLVRLISSKDVGKDAAALNPDNRSNPDEPPDRSSR